jgi:DNA-binding CsgD family transcriptional regulator/transcriptional regulator with GAF, ATPase, and Fis domain
MNSPLTNEQVNKTIFLNKVKLWSDNAAANEFPDWEEQIRLLSEIGELITAELSLEEVIAGIYASVNELMDAYQFAVGLYDEKEAVILFKGMIENGKQFPELVIDAFQENRFAAWCIQHESEIFINDVDIEYAKYVKKIPYPMAGSPPKAALYVPLRMDNKVVGLITVRTPHKNVYQKHHLYILKTLGNFVIKSLAVAQERGKPAVKSEAQQKNWRWCDENQLSFKGKKLLALLTEREKDVLFLLVSGLSNKSIAEKLFVSPATIKTHTLNIYKKMDVRNRTSAIMKAIELNWFL